MSAFLSHSQQDLYRILKAYTIYRPDEGYCQAQAPVAAVLLMHMPAEVRKYGSICNKTEAEVMTVTESRSGSKKTITVTE